MSHVLFTSVINRGRFFTFRKFLLAVYFLLINQPMRNSARIVLILRHQYGISWSGTENDRAIGDFCLLGSVIFCEYLMHFNLTVFNAFRICNYLAIFSRKITSLLEQ